ncbi:MAG: hypothetical protein IPJ88_08085 [Myxococcales bacterium]|nr:MAG: hypothetical protein IPJ88_08085 [Myxococcales bacterium]
MRNTLKPGILEMMLVSIAHKASWLCLILMCTLSCGGDPATRDSATRSGHEVHIVTMRNPGGGYSLHSYDAEQLFRKGNSFLRRGQCELAVHYYDQLVNTFLSSGYVSPALYNAGLCLEQSNNFAAAATRFSLLLERAPTSDDVKHASLRLLALEIRLKRNEKALERTEKLLEDETLSIADRAEVMASRAQALFALGRFASAEHQARQTLQYYESIDLHSEFGDRYFVAAANFILAEVLRTRAESVAFGKQNRDEQRQSFKKRVNLLLDAQKEYFKCIRWAVPHWAVAAGYHIGGMYEALWQDLMSAPLPSDVSKTDEGTYHDELKALLQPLVRHAIRYWELTLRIVERTGTRSAWTKRTRAELERIRVKAYEEWLPEDGTLFYGVEGSEHTVEATGIR